MASKAFANRPLHKTKCSSMNKRKSRTMKLTCPKYLSQHQAGRIVIQFIIPLCSTPYSQPLLKYFQQTKIDFPEDKRRIKCHSNQLGKQIDLDFHTIPPKRRSYVRRTRTNNTWPRSGLPPWCQSPEDLSFEFSKLLFWSLHSTFGDT